MPGGIRARLERGRVPGCEIQGSSADDLNADGAIKDDEGLALEWQPRYRCRVDVEASEPGMETGHCLERVVN